MLRALTNRIRTWFRKRALKIGVLVAVFHVGLTVGLLIAARLGRTEVRI